MPTGPSEGIPDGGDRRGLDVLKRFLQTYLTERDISHALEMFSDQIYGAGTGEGETAVGKEALSRLLKEKLDLLPGPASYTVTDYVQKERAPGCWDCLCRLEISVSRPDGVPTLYRVCLTAGGHQEGDQCVLDILHASQADRDQESGEFLPLKVLSNGGNPLGRDTQYQLMELIGQIMPGGIMGVYVQDGFPLCAVNARLLRMTGYTSYEAFLENIGGLVINSVHPEDRDYVNKEMRRALTPGDQYELKYRMKRRDGSYLWVYGVGRRTVMANGRDAIISVLIDISQQVYDKSCLEYEAVSDPLTGIYNRKGGQAGIERAIQQTSGYLFLMLDLDRFKLVNDLYGHQGGDQVLCFVAKQLAGAFRKTDVVCRLGGDEFAVFVTGCDDPACIRRKVDGLMEAYRQYMQEHWSRAASTLSVGGVYGHKIRSFSELYRLADEMLYAVKNSRRGEMKLRTLE